MSANTNADVAAMDLCERLLLGRQTMLTAVLSQQQTRITIHRTRAGQIADTLDEATALLQSQQAEITRLSAMVEERDRVIRDYMSDCSNVECERCITARQAISTQEPTP